MADSLAALRAHGWTGTNASDALLDLLTSANDASHYLLTPTALVRAEDESEVAALLVAATVSGTAITFRAGGTSLSGQAVTDGVLVDVRRNLRGFEILDDGAAVRAQPGITIGAINTALRRHGRKLGPDPASESAATIGGVIANNSSGMTCGTHANSYQTLRGLRFVLPSGTIIDTEASDADEQLARTEPVLHGGLVELRDALRADPEATSRITRLFAIKNTMGYGLNAFLDHDSAVDILAHLVVGSEGTLAFIASATLATIPLLPHSATGLLMLDDLDSAARALPALIDSGAAVIEILDNRALSVAAVAPDAPAALRDLDLNDEAALLVEYQCATHEELARLVDAASTAFDWSPPNSPLTIEPAERAALWHMRKGLYATIAAARAPGTTALLEDIAVPVDRLPATCAQLQELFAKYGYRDSVIFGHAKDGNIHFLLSENFGAPGANARYQLFTDDLVALVLGHRGTLKAEHGTGRVMAGFVRDQYGDKLYQVMRRIKTLCDPAGILNPGVLLTDDPDAHTRNLKVPAPIEPEVDRCVECGFCEPVCPSRDLTLTPRQRIVARRAISAATGAGRPEVAAELRAAYDYAGTQTCAADGMCQTACPVGIDTGDLARRLRQQGRSRLARAIGRSSARHWGPTTALASAALTLAHHAPRTAGAASLVGRSLLGTDLIPRYDGDLPSGGTRRSSLTSRPAAEVVFLPSCMGTMFGEAEPSTSAAFLSLCDKVGVAVHIPNGVDDLCCGMPFSSKGLARGADIMRQKVLDALTTCGATRVVVDASSCAEGLHKQLEGLDVLTVEDAVAFTARRLLPRLTVRKNTGTIAVHPTCSSVRAGTDAALRELAAAVADNVFVPPGWGCCAFAGDRGLLHPELHASATKLQAAQVRAVNADEHVSCNRTCELGMSRATGRTYRHILIALDEAAQAVDHTVRDDR